MVLKSVIVSVAVLCIYHATAQQPAQPSELTCANRDEYDWNNYNVGTRLGDGDDDPCTCVKYFLCSQEVIQNPNGGSGASKPDNTEYHGGENVIDIRLSGNCDHYLEVCCPPNRIIVEEATGGSTGGIVSGGGTVGGIGGGIGGETGGETGGGIGGETGGGIGGETGGGIGGESGGATGGETGGEGPEVEGNNGANQLGGNIDNRCGNRNPDGLGFCIIGEQNGEAEYGEFPWMVALATKKNSMFVYLCGGSLINRGVVLTAAHCVANLLPTDLVVRAGEWDTQTQNERYPYQDQTVRSIALHEKFNAAALYNDVALLFLQEPFTSAPNIGVACLPHQGAVFPGSTRCFVSGWGKDKYGKNGVNQVILKKLDLPVVPHNNCEKALRKTRLGQRFKLDATFMCAGGESGIDACLGDGGSPLVCPMTSASGEQYYQQAGIVAWGIGCGEQGTPGVYANIALFRNWIDQKMSENVFDVSSYQRQ